LASSRILATRGPSPSVELATRCGLQERYVREWRGQMAVAGYLEYDPGSSRFTLPPEHAAILAEEAGPMFLGGLYHFLPALVALLERLIQALIKLAQAYPKSRYIGYDLHEPAVAKASANAQAAGVRDRVSFRHLDAAKGLPDSYDLITTLRRSTWSMTQSTPRASPGHPPRAQARRNLRRPGNQLAGPP
jgi:Rv2258c-like winged HTH domain